MPPAVSSTASWPAASAPFTRSFSGADSSESVIALPDGLCRRVERAGGVLDSYPGAGGTFSDALDDPVRSWLALLVCEAARA